MGEFLDNKDDPSLPAEIGLALEIPGGLSRND